MKNFIFASILLALLLTVNAAPFQLNKRAITFGHCAAFNDSVDFIDVKIIGTDPPESGKNVSFDVSGTLTKNDITNSKTILYIAYLDDAGNPFNISAFDVPAPLLLHSYLLVVAVRDQSRSKHTTFGCAMAAVGKQF
ncbi:hypothetical protein C2G38_2076030 [Gigaspora rosea]|uniref:MD-2-related lipid-recognition domain-containing protein n=1 Tax=Gigaspora rosea TaxID=44941 RepID=A0A397VIJ4_9GLOM|nr:hypothetical protein C2G38_2076030 [Gigaspora rosea]